MNALSSCAVQASNKPLTVTARSRENQCCKKSVTTASEKKPTIQRKKYCRIAGSRISFIHLFSLIIMEMSRFPLLNKKPGDDVCPWHLAIHNFLHNLGLNFPYTHHLFSSFIANEPTNMHTKHPQPIPSMKNAHKESERIIPG